MAIPSKKCLQNLWCGWWANCALWEAIEQGECSVFLATWRGIEKKTEIDLRYIYSLTPSIVSWARPFEHKSGRVWWMHILYSFVPFCILENRILYPHSPDPSAFCAKVCRFTLNQHTKIYRGKLFTEKNKIQHMHECWIPGSLLSPSTQCGRKRAWVWGSFV